MLDLGNVPLLSKDRTEGMPFVCAGGPCAYNPEPLADFIDFFMMGEGEEIICEVMDIYALWKKAKRPRIEFLEEIAKLEGVYVPCFYDVLYNDDNTIKSIAPNNPNAKGTIKKRIILDMDKVYYPKKFVVPNIGIVHDRIMLEVFRGCTRGCRFCQAGIIYRPVRERSSKHLTELAKELIKNTGYEELSMTSLSTSDYTELPVLCENLIELTKENHINLTLPSLRIDNFSLEIMSKVRHAGLTFAPEAGTQRLRDVINKNITEEDVVSSTSLAFNGGYSGVKLYFMLGLPTETDEDVEGIASLASLVLSQYYTIPKDKRPRGLSITVSTSCFVPKPHTPFQWEPMDNIDELERKQKILQGAIKQRQIKYNWHDADLSYLEAVFARGDRRLCKAMLKAFEKGFHFDSWSEHFSFEGWMEVFRECGIDSDFYVTRRRDIEEILPWEHIDVGVTKEFLKRELKKAYNAQTTAECRTSCSGCGAARFKGGVCVG